MEGELNSNDLVAIHIPDPDRPESLKTLYVPRAQVRALASAAVPSAARHGLPDCPLFTDLDDSSLAELSRQGRRRQFDEGSTIHKAGEAVDFVTVVLAGKVRWTLRGERTEVTSIRRPGDIVDYGTFVRPTHVGDASALTACVLLQFQKDQFIALMKGHAQFAVNVVHAVTETSLEFNEQALFTGQRTYERLVNRFISMAENDGTPQVDGRIRINTPLTQLELAKLIGAARETVNIGFKRLAEAGAVGREGRYIFVNPELLHKALRKTD